MEVVAAGRRHYIFHAPSRETHVQNTTMPSAPFDGNRRLPAITNEPIRSYAPGSPERSALKARLDAMEKECPEIPLIIGGREIRTGDIAKATSPHKHGHVTATWHKARTEDVQAAIKAAGEAQRDWSTWRWEDRAAILLKAAIVGRQVVARSSASPRRRSRPRSTRPASSSTSGA